MDCLSDSDVSRYLGDALGEPERRELEEHLSRCPRCRRRVVERHAAAEDEAGPGGHRAPRWLKRRVTLLPWSRSRHGRPSQSFWAFPMWSVAAAALVLVVGAGVFWTRDSPRSRHGGYGDVSILRAEPAGSLAPRLLAPADGTSAVGASAVGEVGFRWTEVADARDYRITLLDARGNVVHESTDAATSAALDLGAAGITSGSYFWFVSAAFPDGTHMDSSVSRLVLR